MTMAFYFIANEMEQWNLVVCARLSADASRSNDDSIGTVSMALHFFPFQVGN